MFSNPMEIFFFKPMSSGGSLRGKHLSIKGEQVGEIKISVFLIYLYLAHFSGSLAFSYLTASGACLEKKSLLCKPRRHSDTSVTNFQHL